MHIKVNKPRFRSKIAFFDYDWTLAKPKSGGTFPKNVDDWMWLREDVPDVVKSFYTKGFGICIVTNQSKAWKIDQIKAAIMTLGIPAYICIAFQKDQYKPNLFIYHEAFSEEQRNKVKVSKSFMVGDALGRPNDHSDCDLSFAHAVGVKCYAPEEVFGMKKNDAKIKGNDAAKLEAKSHQEVIVMVGLPGSGKSWVSNTVFENAGYMGLHSDELKTPERMMKEGAKHIALGKSIVFDATNPARERRMLYVSLAKKNNLPVRCVYMTTDYDTSYERNNKQDKPVPKIVYVMYQKKFEAPNKYMEGFDELVLV
jgi:bifunctional polynucleotide phosphatase/kinase